MSRRCCCSVTRAIAAVNLVVGAAPLQVGRIVVTGNVRLSSAEVEALTRGLYGRSILTADLELPAAASCSTRRGWPMRRCAGCCRPRSRCGSPKATADRHQPARQPALSDRSLRHGDRRVRAAGIASSTCRSSTAWCRTAEEAASRPSTRMRAALAARVLDSVATRKAIARGCRRSTSPTPHDVVVLLEGDPAQLRLGEERFVERLQAYLEVASALRARIADIDYVDLRFDDRVYVKPRGAAGTVEAGQSAGASHNVLRGIRGTKGTLRGGSGRRHVQDHRHRRRDDRRWGAGHHRDGAGRLARDPARGGGQPRGGGRVDQEGDRGSRADRPASRSIRVHLGLSGTHVKAFNSRGVVAVAGKNREITREDVRRAIDAAQGGAHCRAAARSCTCCRRTSWSTSRTASAPRSA